MRAPIVSPNALPPTGRVSAPGPWGRSHERRVLDVRHPRRVALLAWDGQQAGGAQTLLRSLARTGSQAEQSLHFAFLSEGGPAEEEIRALGWPTTVLGWRRGFDLRGRQKLFKWLRSVGPVLVHDQGLPPLTRALTACVAPVLAHEHGRFLLRQPQYRWLGRREDAVTVRLHVAISSFVRHELMRLDRIPGHKITVIPNGVDFEYLGPPRPVRRRSDRDCLRVGFLGRWDKIKGIEDLPLVAERLRSLWRGPSRLVIGGAGPDEDKLRARIVELGVQDRVDAIGLVYDVGAFLRSLDVLLLPSQWPEPFALVGIEALGLGVPVAGYAVGALPEILGPYESARLVGLGDVHALAGAAIELSQIPDSVRLDAARTVRKKYSSRVWADRVFELYEALLAS